MKHSAWALGLAFALVAGVAAAGDDHASKKSAESPAVDPAAMGAVEKSATPNENHKRLDFFVGDWTAEISMWMSPGEPMKSEGKAHCDWTMGGRSLHSS